MTRHDFHGTIRRVHAMRRWPDALVLGVCAALAMRFGISPWWFRAATIAGVFSAPLTTVILYGLAAILLARNPAWRWPS
jgi:phage shock protein PspC (stress-responsive transcriptional regulator)